MGKGRKGVKRNEVRQEGRAEDKETKEEREGEVERTRQGRKGRWKKGRKAREKIKENCAYVKETEDRRTVRTAREEKK